MSAKVFFEIFFILFRFWVIDRLGFCECVNNRVFFSLLNNVSSYQNKKTPEQPFADIGK